MCTHKHIRAHADRKGGGRKGPEHVAQSVGWLPSTKPQVAHTCDLSTQEMGQEDREATGQPGIDEIKYGRGGRGAVGQREGGREGQREIERWKSQFYTELGKHGRKH